jgi:hypothetical protein
VEARGGPPGERWVDFPAEFVLVAGRLFEVPADDLVELGEFAGAHRWRRDGLAWAAAQVWMVGDNPAADVDGAQAAGIPAIQVRTARGEVERYAQDLGAAAAIIRGEMSSMDADTRAGDGGQ